MSVFQRIVLLLVLVFLVYAAEVPCVRTDVSPQEYGASCSKTLLKITIFNRNTFPAQIVYASPNGTELNISTIPALGKYTIPKSYRCLGAIYRGLYLSGGCPLQFVVDNSTSKYELLSPRTCDNPGVSRYGPGKAKALNVTRGITQFKNGGTGVLYMLKLLPNGRQNATLYGNSPYLPPTALSKKQRAYVGDRWIVVNKCDNRCLRIVEIKQYDFNDGLKKTLLPSDSCGLPTPTPLVFPPVMEIPNVPLPNGVRNCSYPGFSNYTSVEARRLGLPRRQFRLKNRAVSSFIRLGKVTTRGQIIRLIKLVDSGILLDALPGKVLSGKVNAYDGDIFVVFNACDGKCLRIIVVSPIKFTKPVNLFSARGYECTSS